MSRLAVLAVAVVMVAGGMAMADDLPENHALAAAIAKGREHRSVADAADAEAYAARITMATYGEKQTKAQLPFHAIAEGDRWKVVGSRPMDLGTMSGPLTIVVRRDDGAVQEIVFTAAPSGWDTEILRKLAAKH